MKTGKKPVPVLDRLLARVERNEANCWIWTGAKNNQGYGVIGVGQKKTALVHRVSYEEHCGPIPDRMTILHGCDTPLCCNPDHLKPGTHAENMADMAKKGRSGMAKLKAEQIAEIRRRLEYGEVQTRIAGDYGVCQRTICRIGRMEIYKHV